MYIVLASEKLDEGVKLHQVGGCFSLCQKTIVEVSLLLIFPPPIFFLVSFFLFFFFLVSWPRFGLCWFSSSDCWLSGFVLLPLPLKFARSFWALRRLLTFFNWGGWIYPFLCLFTLVCAFLFLCVLEGGEVIAGGGGGGWSCHHMCAHICGCYYCTRGVASGEWRCFAGGGGVWGRWAPQQGSGQRPENFFESQDFWIKETNNFTNLIRLSGLLLGMFCWLAWLETHTCPLKTQREREIYSETAR